MRQRCGDVTRVVHCTGVAPGGDGRRSTSRPMCACGPRPCVGADPPAGGIGEKNPCHAPTPIHCAARGALGGGRSDSDGRNQTKAERGRETGSASARSAGAACANIRPVRATLVDEASSSFRSPEPLRAPGNFMAPAAVPTSIGLRAHRTSVFSPLYGRTTIGVRTFFYYFSLLPSFIRPFLQLTARRRQRPAGTVCAGPRNSHPHPTPPAGWELGSCSWVVCSACTFRFRLNPIG